MVVRNGKSRCVGHRCDPNLERELLAHELGHWLTRVRHCGEERVRVRGKLKTRAKTCKAYQGEHNHKFYRVLDRIQKYFKNSRYRAKLLEARAGYRPPRNYLR